MPLKEIIAISGISGLHKIIASKKSGFLVENLHTKKKIATSSQQKVSIIEEISMYKEDGDEKLGVILKSIHTLDKKGEKIPTSKDTPSNLYDFFKKVLPDYDKDRVYLSDIKRLMTWYSILSKHVKLADIGKKKKEDKKGTEPKTTKKAPTKSSAKPRHTQQKISKSKAPAKKITKTAKK